MGETIHGGAIWGSVKKSDLLAGVALALLFAAFFRALVGATTFRSMGEVGFLIGASSALALGLLVGITTALPARLPAILAASMAAGALVDSLVAVVIGRASTVALTLVLVLLGLAALAAYFAMTRKAEGLEQFASRAPLSYKLLAFPLGYLLLLVVAIGTVFGCVFMVHVGGLNKGLSQLGFFVGCIFAGAVVLGLPCLTKTRPLEVMSNAMLVFLVAGLSLFLLFQASFVSLMILAIGFCCFMALALRMAFDFYATFSFPLLLPVCLVALLFGSILTGLFLGQLLVLSGSIENLDVFTVASMGLVNLVTVLGMGTNHSWDTSRLVVQESLAPRETASARALWKESVEEMAREHGLTRRETEVLALMARGRNAAYIEEQLVVSNHTARAHILNIYKKTDLHSQQAVIDSVEQRVEAKRETSGSAES